MYSIIKQQLYILQSDHHCKFSQHPLSGAARTSLGGDKVTGGERNLQAALPLEVVPGAGMSLSSFCLTVVGLSINLWKYNI